MSKIERLSAARAIYSKVGLHWCLLHYCQRQHLHARKQREELHSHTLPLKGLFTGLLGIKSQLEESPCCYPQPVHAILEMPHPIPNWLEDSLCSCWTSRP